MAGLNTLPNFVQDSADKFALRTADARTALDVLCDFLGAVLIAGHGKPRPASTRKACCISGVLTPEHQIFLDDFWMTKRYLNKCLGST